MNKTMTAIADATRAAIMSRGDGKAFHRTISSHGYEVERDMPAEGYRFPGKEGTVKVYYRGTCVAEIDDEGTATLNSGGWRTPTTKNVINAALDGARIEASVFQAKGTWRVAHDWAPLREADKPVDYWFEDGMTVMTYVDPIGRRTTTFGYRPDEKRCRYDFRIVGVTHGNARPELGGMCETCRAS